MGSSFMQSRLHGGNRFFSTMVGGFIGMGLFAIYMELFPDGSNSWVLIPLTFVGVIILILLCQHIWVGGVQPGGVVLCILLFNTPTDTYITYAMNRILDTGIGVLAAIFVNGMLPGGFTFSFMHRQICKKYRSPAEKTFSRGVFYLRPQGLTRKFRVKPEKEEVHFMEAHFHLT